MFLSLIISRHFLAALLPVALLSVFFACIMTCSAHSVEAMVTRAAMSDQTTVTGTCDSCPITGELSCGLPERPSSLTRANDHPIPVIGHTRLITSSDFSFVDLRFLSPPTHDPPLKRLSVLRI